jgi:hypothetical protein
LHNDNNVCSGPYFFLFYFFIPGESEHFDSDAKKKKTLKEFSVTGAVVDVVSLKEKA